MSQIKKTALIIGSGIGGLSAGIYGQLSGLNTKIFEMHSIPGGQCTGYKRKGYTFDLCIHHFYGTNEKSPIYSIWKDIGALPRPIVFTNECVSVRSPEGHYFHDYWDIDKLYKHLIEISPEDKKVIKNYI